MLILIKNDVIFFADHWKFQNSKFQYFDLLDKPVFRKLFCHTTPLTLKINFRDALLY